MSTQAGFRRVGCSTAWGRCALAAGAAAYLVALVGCSGTAETTFDCSLAGRKAFVGDIMTDYYLWYDEIPEVDYVAAESPASLMRAMMYEPLDHWSGIQQLQERREYFDEGRFLGLGYTLGRDPAGGLRISWVHEGSSAGRAGLDRGALILAVNGIPLEELSNRELGDEIARDVVVHTIQELDGSVRVVSLEQDDVTITSVKSTTILDTDAGKVGYLMFTTFVLPGEDELRQAFSLFQRAGVQQLVIDLRYNSGGLLRTAALLGSLIRSSASGQPLIVETYNDRHPRLNRERKLFAEEHAIDATRVVFLTSGRTASASEQVINGLRPYLDVDIVGETTLGKPVGSDSFQHCGYAIAPITFHSLNASGEGDYFRGINPGCNVADDLLHPLGDPEEAQLKVALGLLDGRACQPSIDLQLSSVSQRLVQPPAQAAEPLPPGPLQGVLGWY